MFSPEIVSAPVHSLPNTAQPFAEARLLWLGYVLEDFLSGDITVSEMARLIEAD